jgi:hypothetical protein
MPKLTDTQLVILSAAAKRENLAVLPLPKSLKCNKGALTTVLKSLLSRGLVTERPAMAGEAAWREEEDGQRLGLMLADSGLRALGIEPRASKATSANATSETRAGTKLATVVVLLKRKGGATISDIAAATGWQTHSVRGAISGALKKKMGLSIVSASEDGRGRVYRITGGSR